MKQSILELKQEMQSVLAENILPYWMNRMVDEEYGGFYGQITGMEELMYNPQIEMFARFKMKSSFHKTKRII